MGTIGERCTSGGKRTLPALDIPLSVRSPLAATGDEMLVWSAARIMIGLALGAMLPVASGERWSGDLPGVTSAWAMLGASGTCTRSNVSGWKDALVSDGKIAERWSAGVDDPPKPALATAGWPLNPASCDPASSLVTLCPAGVSELNPELLSAADSFGARIDVLLLAAGTSAVRAMFEVCIRSKGMGAAPGWSSARRLMTWAATLADGVLAAGVFGKACVPLRRCKSGSALHSRAGVAARGAGVATEAVPLVAGSRCRVAVGSMGTIGERCTSGGKLVLPVVLAPGDALLPGVCADAVFDPISAVLRITAAVVGAKVRSSGIEPEVPCDDPAL
jgi:hypothetical protein